MVLFFRFINHDIRYYIVVIDTLSKKHNHLHKHVIKHTHDGSSHTHVVEHEHEHNHYLSDKKHTHKHDEMIFHN